MGFETQEEAERFAENIEFLADSRKEEALLNPKGPHADDRKTLAQIVALARYDYPLAGAMDDAYHLGRLRGRMEGAVAAAEKIGKALK